MNPPPPIEPAPASARRKGVLVVVLAAAAVVLLSVFFRLNPAEHSFFPRCVFHAASGLECPGCGGQRALHQLLHGEVATALRYNALFVLMLPVGGWFLFRAVWQQISGRTLLPQFSHHRWPWVMCGLVIVFGILRNLPGFEWLRP